jgi:UDP-glucose 4-epimerase
VILITGGMGFIGLHTARRFLDAGEDVVITRHNAWREPDFIRDEYGKRVKVERADVTSPHDMLDVVGKHKVTGIVHLAVPGLAALSAAEDYRVNTAGLLSVLEAARIWGVRRVTLASSIAIYGSLPQGPFREDALLPVESGNPTETFKKTWEILGLHYAARTSLDLVSIRIGGIYGPLYHSMANLASRLCHAAVRGAAPDFSPARGGVPFADDAQDWGYVRDCARGIQMLQMAPKLQHRVYNLGGGRGVPNRELLAAVRKAVPSAQGAVQAGRGPRGRSNPYMDMARIGQELGFKPEYDIERGVSDYFEWLRKNPE